MDPFDTGGHFCCARRFVRTSRTAAFRYRTAIARTRAGFNLPAGVAGRAGHMEMIAPSQTSPALPAPKS